MFPEWICLLNVDNYSNIIIVFYEFFMSFYMTIIYIKFNFFFLNGLFASKQCLYSSKVSFLDTLFFCLLVFCFHGCLLLSNYTFLLSMRWILKLFSPPNSTFINPITFLVFPLDNVLFNWWFEVSNLVSKTFAMSE